MEILTTLNFNGISLDCYKGDDGDIWLTDEQVGQILGYGQNSINAIQDIHRQHFGRLENFQHITKDRRFITFVVFLKFAVGFMENKLMKFLTQLLFCL